LISEQRGDAEFIMAVGIQVWGERCGLLDQLPASCGSRLSRARNNVVAHFSSVIDWKEVR
jgi:hypothetical protein